MGKSGRSTAAGAVPVPGTSDPGGGHAIGGPWPLVGRAEAVRELRAALVGGSGRGVMLAGAVGVGKSRLAAEGLAVAERAGLATARASATRASSDIPFGALAPLLPAVRSAEPGLVDDRADLLRRFTSALIERAGDGRLVLFVDDAHLLDGMSATLVHQLAEVPRIQLLLTVRSGEPAPDPIVALWKDGLVDRVEVGGLGVDAVGEVLSWVLGGPVDDAAVADLAARSGGNMLFLREIVVGAVESGVLCDDGGVWRIVGALHPSDRLVELVEARLAGLAPGERALMEAVSFGEPLGTAELLALSDVGVAEALERKGLLVSHVSGNRLTVGLAHPLYGEVLRSRVPALRARAIARALAEAVERTGARRREDVLRIANWRLLGGGAGPELLLEAAVAARWRYDFALAERLARAASAVGAGFEAELLTAQLAALQGRSAEARTLLAGVAERACRNEQRALVALSRLDNRIIYDGALQEGIEVAEEAGRVLAGTPWEDEIRARHAALLLATEGPRAATAMVGPLLGGASGRALVWACMPGSYSLARSGRIEDALTAARRGREAQLELTEPMDWYPSMHRFYEAEALFHAGRLDDAEALATAQYREALDQRSVEAQALFAWQLAKGVTDRGDVESAIRRAQTAIAIYRQLGRPQFVEFCLIYLAMAHGIGGRGDAATAALRQREELGIVTSFFMGVDLLQARGWAEVAAGNVRGGAHWFREAAAAGERIGDLVGSAAALHDLARTGRPGEAADRLRELAAQIEGPMGAARAAHTCALAAEDPRELEQLGADFGRMGAHLLAAEASADAAMAWKRRGDARKATAAGQRAVWLAARCPGSATPALQRSEPRAALTAAELEAARLAATGLTNRQIAERAVVSVRTIENRLQAVYTKLGLEGRSGLAEALDTIGGQ